MTKKKSLTIPKFSSEREEAAWWDAHRSEIELEIRANIRKPNGTKRSRFEELADRLANEIDERAARMTPKERARADAETKRIADRVQRRTR